MSEDNHNNDGGDPNVGTGGAGDPINGSDPNGNAGVDFSGVLNGDGSFADGWTGRFEGADELGDLKSIGDLVKFAAESKARGSVPSRPGDDASDEEVAAWNEFLGVPSTVDGYDVPEGADDEHYKRFAEVARKAGVTPKQMKELVAYNAQCEQDAVAADDAEFEQADAETVSYFKDLWGGDFEVNKKMLGEGLLDMGIDPKDVRTKWIFANKNILEAVWDKVVASKEGMFPAVYGSGGMSQADAGAEAVALLKEFNGDMSLAPASKQARYRVLLEMKARRK